MNDDTDDLELAAALGLIDDPKPIKPPEFATFDPTTVSKLPPREQFAALSKVLDELKATRKRMFDESRAGYAAELESLWRKVRKRGAKKFVLSTAEVELAPMLPDIIAKHRGYYDAGEPAFDKAIRHVETFRMIAANDVKVATGGEDHWYFRDYYPSAYSTQGGGAEKYAEVRAQLTAADLEASGLKAEVRRHFSAAQTLPFFAVYVWCPECDLPIVKAKSGLPMPELVRLAWKFGANPRVYFPFLEHGYETKHGFNQFGDMITRALGEAATAQKSEPDPDAGINHHTPEPEGEPEPV